MTVYKREQVLKMLDSAQKAGDEPAVQALLTLLPNPAQAGDQINQEEGARLATRALVGGARDVDQLASMQNLYPEAQPFGDGNFAYYNRANSQPQLYNPPGFDVGDVAEYGRGISQVGAAMLTGAPTLATTGPGALPITAAAATGTGLLYDEAMGALGQVDSRDVGQRLIDTGVEFGMEMIPFDKFLGSARDAISPRFQSFMSNANKNIAQVARKYDITPTAGVVGNRMIGALDASSQKIFTGMDAWQESADVMMEGVATMLDKFHASLGGVSNPSAAGSQIVNKAQKYQEQFIDASTALYDELAELIPRQTRFDGTNFNNFLSDNIQRFRDDPGLSKILTQPIMQQLSDVSTPDYAYGTLKELRTLIGSKMKDHKDTIGDLTQRELGQLYQALTKDIEDGAMALGDDAVGIVNKAQEHYRTGREIIENFIEPTMMRGGVWATGMEAFNNIKRMASDPDKLGNLSKSGILDQRDLDSVGSAMLSDVGQATGGAQNAARDRLDPARILSQTDDKVLSKEAQKILLNKSAREIMADMRVFAEGVQGVNAFVNRSNTSTANSIAQTGTAVSSAGALVANSEPGLALATIATTMLLPYMASKGLQSSWVKDWLTQAPREATGEFAQQEWINRGARIAAANGAGNIYTAFTEIADVGFKEQGALEE